MTSKISENPESSSELYQIPRKWKNLIDFIAAPFDMLSNDPILHISESKETKNKIRFAWWCALIRTTWIWTPSSWPNHDNSLPCNWVRSPTTLWLMPMPKPSSSHCLKCYTTVDDLTVSGQDVKSFCRQPSQLPKLKKCSLRFISFNEETTTSIEEISPQGNITHPLEH